MTDPLPLGIAVDRTTVQTWLDNAKPGEMPPDNVRAAHARCQQWFDAQKPSSPAPRVESAIDKFKRTIRQDSPPVMPSWQAPAGNQSQAVERAADRFKRLRLAGVDQSNNRR